MARENSKKAVGSSLHTLVTFTIRFDPSSTVLAPHLIKWKKYHFSRKCFLLITFLYERYENENGTIVFASLSWFVTCAIWPWKVNFKIWLQVRSGQVRSRSSHAPSKSICISSEAAWRAKSLGTIRASLLYLVANERNLSEKLTENLSKLMELIEKRIVTSFDLRWTPRGPRSAVAPE